MDQGQGKSAKRDSTDFLDSLASELKDTEIADEVLSPFNSHEAGSVGKYLILETVAIHKNVVVFKAQDPDLDRLVALKIYYGELTESRREQVLAEGRAHAKIDCPNVIRCHSVESVGNAPVLVNEWVDGKPLDQFTQDRSLTFSDIRKLFEKISRGIGKIHAQGLIHRDIKPSNIVVDQSGEPKILDLGLVQTIDEKNVSLAGTCAYMAPEVVRGNISEIGTATDIFGLGGVLYFLLSGQPLYDGDSRTSTFDLARRCEFEQPIKLDSSVPAQLNQVCVKCLSENPDDRYQSVDEIIQAISPPSNKPLLLAIAATLILVGAVWWFDSLPKPDDSLAVSIKQETPAPSPETPPENSDEAAPPAKKKARRHPAALAPALQGDYKKAAELTASDLKIGMKSGNPAMLSSIWATHEFCINFCIADDLNFSQAITQQDELIAYLETVGPIISPNWLGQAKIDKEQLLELENLLQDPQDKTNFLGAFRQMLLAELTTYDTGNRTAKAVESATATGFNSLAAALGESGQGHVEYTRALLLLVDAKRFAGQEIGLQLELEQLEQNFKNIYGDICVGLMDLYDKAGTYWENLGYYNLAAIERKKFMVVVEDLFSERHPLRQLGRLKSLDIHSDPVQAIQGLKEFVQLHETHMPTSHQTGQVYMKLAKAHFNANEYENCELAINKAIDNFAQQPAGRMIDGFKSAANRLLARNYLAMQRAEDAIRVIKPLIENQDLAQNTNSREYAELKLLHGQAEWGIGQQPDALAKIKNALKNIRGYRDNNVRSYEMSDLEMGINARFEVPFLLTLLKYSGELKDWSAFGNYLSDLKSIAEEHDSDFEIANQIDSILDEFRPGMPKELSNE